MSPNLPLSNKIASVFRPYLNCVYQELQIGLCKSNVEIEYICNASHESDCQFRVIIPYCSKKLRWEVLFDTSNPSFAPDFRFDDEGFINSLSETILEEKVPCLAQWQEVDPKALSNVLSEFISLYKSHQISKLNENEHSRAYFEYTALLGNEQTNENDIEVWVSNHMVDFLIKLNIDVSKLPELYNDSVESNPGIDSALLLVKYPNATNAELILSPLLTKALGNITLPHLHQSGVLMDYVPMVTKSINKRIQTVLKNEACKRDLLSTMIVKYEGAVLEHDANGASFLFETDQFYWVLQVDLAPSYPERPPLLTIKSVYDTFKGKPKFKTLSGCPYNNIEPFIEQNVELFIKECRGITEDIDP